MLLNEKIIKQIKIAHGYLTSNKTKKIAVITVIQNTFTNYKTEHRIVFKNNYFRLNFKKVIQYIINSNYN